MTRRVVIVLVVALAASVGFKAWREWNDCDPANLIYPCHVQVRVVVHQPRAPAP